MISQVIQYKNLDEKYKSAFNPGEIDPERMVYVIKDNSGHVKSITTSVLASIQKVQAK